MGYNDILLSLYNNKREIEAVMCVTINLDNDLRNFLTKQN